MPQKASSALEHCEIGFGATKVTKITRCPSNVCHSPDAHHIGSRQWQLRVSHSVRFAEACLTSTTGLRRRFCPRCPPFKACAAVRLSPNGCKERGPGKNPPIRWPGQLQCSKAPDSQTWLSTQCFSTAHHSLCQVCASRPLSIFQVDPGTSDPCPARRALWAPSKPRTGKRTGKSAMPATQHGNGPRGYARMAGGHIARHTTSVFTCQAPLRDCTAKANCNKDQISQHQLGGEDRDLQTPDSKRCL